MKLSSAIVGEQAGPLEASIDARWLMAYSAGLGETDPRCYDTERGVLAHPLFPVCYEWPVAQPLRALPALKPLFPQLLHAQHDLRIHRAPRAGDRLRTSARIIAVTQRKPGAFVVFRFEARDAAGQAVTTTDFGALYRGVTVERGDRALEEVADPAPFEATFPEYSKIDIPANAAHVYTECARVWNPIHTDVAVARAAGLPDIILHGTATLALAVSRVLRHAGADPRAVSRVSARFAGMVRLPSGLTLRVGEAAEGKTFVFDATGEDGALVLNDGALQIA